MNEPISFCVQINSVQEVIPSIEEKKALLAIAIFNSIVALPTAALNALIIVAIASTPALVTPSYLLLMNLAFTDLLVGLFGQPLQSAMVLYYRNHELFTYCYIRSISAGVLVVSTSASILTVTAIAVDRYLAIRLKMRYRSVVTVPRVKRILVVVWGYSIAAAIFPFCVTISIASITASSFIIFCLLITVISYVMAFKALKKHLTQIQALNDQQMHSNPAIDVHKYQKLLKTMLIILVFIVACYSIMAITSGMFSNPKYRKSLMWSLLSSAYLNSTFNPVIYLTRMTDLRKACNQVLRKYVRLF